MDIKNNFKNGFNKIYKDFVCSSQFAVVLLLNLTQTVILGIFQIYIKSETYNDNDTAKVAIFSLLVTLVFSAILRVYCSFHMGKTLGLISDNDINSFTKRTFLDWSVVEVRAQLRILVGLLLFIIPGIIEALRLSLAVPMSFYDKRMNDKTFDPIHASREILNTQNSVLWHLFAIMMLIPIVLHISLQMGEVSFFASLGSMLHALFSALIMSFYTVYTFLYITFLYKSAVLEPASKLGED